MQQTDRTKKFYISLREAMIQTDMFPMTSFAQNNEVPNFVRTDDRKMKLWGSRITHEKPVILKDFYVLLSKGEWTLHIMTGAVELLSANQEVIGVLPRKTSWKIEKLNWKNEVRAMNNPAWIAVEFKEEPEANYNPRKR